MATSDITGGLVRIKDGVKKTEEYAPSREVTVELRFENAEGGDYRAIFEQAANAANAKVNELLGKTAVLSGPEKPHKVRAEKPPKADAAVVAGEPVKVVDPASMGEPKQAIQSGGERVDPAAMGGKAVANDDVFTSAPAEANITDNDLMAAITRKNAETKNPLAIRGLISKYVPQDGKPHQAAEIEQGKRAAFKLELAQVAKAEAA